MGIATGRPNEFRESLRPGRSERLIIVDKQAKGDRSADGLGAVKVPRAEIRQTDQRDGDRHRLDGERTQIRRKGKTHSVELINLSQGGAMVAGDFTAKLWDKVALVLAPSTGAQSGGEIECAVRWLRDGKIGLEFAHETHIECDRATLDDLLREVIHNSFPDVEINARGPVPHRPAEHDRKRGGPRHPLIWKGVLHHEYNWQAARLRNISATGALIECAEPVPDGANVTLDLQETGRIAARVQWMRGDEVGLLFDQPFDVSTLSKAKPVLAAKTGAKSHFAPYGRGCDQSPWAPEWNRLSIDELGADLGG